MDWFLYDNGLRNERVESYSPISVFFLGQSDIHIFRLAQYICQFTLLDLHIPGRFRCLPGGTFTPTSHSRKFLKI